MPHSGKTARGRVYVRRTLAERFWKYVNKSGPSVRQELGPCWLWTGSILQTGYGCIRNENKSITAHLASWLVHGNSRPARGLMICHRCDVRKCVNPEHFFIGTGGDNIRDAVAKGRMVQQYAPHRMARGSRHGQSKLTEEQVREIKSLAGSASHTAIGARFGVSGSMVGYILRGDFWRHVP